MKKLFLLDISAYLFRSYYAIRNMSDPEGKSTNALYGLIRAIQKLENEFAPEHIAAVFDGPNNKQSRLEIYPEYKQNRQSIPEDLPYQITWAKEFCDLYGIPVLNIEGVEADDTMGSIARWAAEEGYEVYLCSGDKDLCQLVDQKIRILQTHKDNLILDTDQVYSKYGVYPNQIIDWLAITGDSSDNVPGLPGFGPKTATQLLTKFGTLEKILASPDQIPGKKKQETIRELKDLAILSKQLVTLDTSVEFPKNQDFFFYKGPENTEDLRAFFENRGFNSLVKTLSKNSNSPSSTKPTSSTEYHLVHTDKDLQKCISSLKKATSLAFSTVTTSSDPFRADLVGISFCTQEKQAWYIPCKGGLSLETIRSSLSPIFSDTNKQFIGHNTKHDLHTLTRHRFTLPSLHFDTMLASYICDSHSHRHTLDFLVTKHLELKKTPLTQLTGKGAKAISILDIPLQEAADYYCEYSDYIFRIWKKLSPELLNRELNNLFYDVEMPLLSILYQMEESGIYIDIACLETLGKELRAELASLQKRIYQEAGSTFNINSPKQLSQILFDQLQLPVLKKTQTGRSTDIEVLQSLKSVHPIAEILIQYRQLEKLRSTYVEALPLEIHPDSKRIHCTFSQTTAATGRLSCHNPNLQNIPVRTPMGRQIRQCFLPQHPDHVFLSADYSQIELRLLAHFSQDPNLIQAFQEGADIHAHTASLVFDTPIEAVSSEQRYRAKTVNFGILYGQQAFGLSKELGISRKEAEEFIQSYFARYPKVKQFIDDAKNQARQTQKSLTLLGRERAIPEINSKNAHIRSAAERLAVNTPIQGTAADLIKLAMLRVDKKLQESAKIASLILQVHDELIFDLHSKDVQKIGPIIKESMESVFQLSIPLVVDVSVGKNWKEC